MEMFLKDSLQQKVAIFPIVKCIGTQDTHGELSQDNFYMAEKTLSVLYLFCNPAAL